ncbi:MAG: uroporphyrinogen-III C-methyltransferase [Halobacterium sp.]
MSTHTGTVSLVGAGPGDPELLTVKARNRIDDADVVLHDSLVGCDVVASLPETATVVDVGKRADGKRTSQEEINHLMVREANAGNDVVRLKGGDPHVFGRGGEEAEFLARHDVPVEVVPGVTSAIAAPGVAGIPVTHREHASSLTVVTGHEAPTKPESALDWDALAGNVRAGGTLVVLMGVGRLPDNVAALRSHGVAPETPVALVEKATLPDEATVTGTLDTIVDRVDDAGIEPPAVTVVGDVVGVRETVASCLGGEGAAGADAVSWQAAFRTAESGAEVN